MSPESIEAHNKVKIAITAELHTHVRDHDLGEAYANGVLTDTLAADESLVSARP